MLSATILEVMLQRQQFNSNFRCGRTLAGKPGIHFNRV